MAPASPVLSKAVAYSRGMLLPLSSGMPRTYALGIPLCRLQKGS